MLELRQITKVYPSSGEDVHALKGIDLKLRQNEFVAILGPSGCGKTTLLNILGGLDRFTGGDLLINGITTGEYRDRDWDTYRNHRVGFVFQSYNLIPHQTVLQNVELSLALTGVSKLERRRRAREALEKVGLGDQIRKKPGTMSGGQCQRVAIARAIVNDPDIILADEPTGALDTETSIQVMEILKEISRDRLVVMVTHNPDLADRYATRTVRMLDGLITADSDPVSDEELQRENAAAEERRMAKGKTKTPSMSFATSFGLSLKNLISKYSRTTLTAFAGSIGIIGIALIYAVSHGTTVFIDSVQEETLSSYPITIKAQTIDTSSLLTVFMGEAESISSHDDGAVYQKAMLYKMMNAMNTMEARENDLKSFKRYIEGRRGDPEDAFGQALTGVQYTYNVPLTVYTRNVDGEILQADTQNLLMDLMLEYLGVDMSGVMSMSSSTVLGSSYTEMMTQNMSLWKELLPGENGAPVNPVTEKQYDIIYGRWPSRYDEVVLFVDENNEIDDMTLYALGLKSQTDMDTLMAATIAHEAVDYEVESWSFEEICGMDFRAVLECDCWVCDEASDAYTDLRDSETGLNYLYDNALVLHVVGIARPDPGAVAASKYNYIGYTSALTEYAIRHQAESQLILRQMEDPETDVFTSLPFAARKTAQADKASLFTRRVSSMTIGEKAALYEQIMTRPSEDMTQQYVAQYFSSMTREEIEQTAIDYMQSQSGMKAELVKSYLAGMSDEELMQMFSSYAEQQYATLYAQQSSGQLSELDENSKAYALDAMLKIADEATLASYYDEFTPVSKASYEENLKKLGCIDMDSPASVNLYASSFANKDVITAAIAEYNRSVPELEQIQYADIVGIMMSSITTIIDAITYVLIAFVSVSLIVSSIMIGVITLISVQERTKEIGILRAIGASKRNVSGMFNAETVMIGLMSGIIGVLVTYLLCIPINMILHRLTDLNNLSAQLPLSVALILVAISTLLTLIAGVIPSRSAAKKDPVAALRTE